MHFFDSRTSYRHSTLLLANSDSAKQQFGAKTTAQKSLWPERQTFRHFLARHFATDAFNAKKFAKIFVTVAAYVAGVFGVRL